MVKIFEYLESKKAKKIPFEFKLLYSLPLIQDDLTINRYLNLSRTKILLLPNNLTVNGSLDIRISKITYLPNDLTVNGHLYIEATQISKLPDNLYVTDNLWCRFTPLADDIKNNVYLLNYYSKQIKGKIIYD